MMFRSFRTTANASKSKLSDWEARPRAPRTLWSTFGRAGLALVLLFGNAGSALVGFTCAGGGLATIIPNTFAAAGNIEGSAPGPSLAVVTTAGYVGFLAGPPLIGFVAQLSTIRAALWILVVLSGLSAFASTSMKRNSPLGRIP